MNRSRGQHAGLTRDAVLDAALELVRVEGADALSMRRVAVALGVAPNALYSHVADKNALLDGVLDLVLGGVAIPARGGWRTRVEDLMGNAHTTLLAHPELIPHFLARQTRGPNALALGEATLVQLARGGVTGRRAVVALQALLVHTIGSAAMDAPRRAEPAPSARRARAVAVARASALPHTAGLARPLASPPSDRTFKTGLRWLLDGIAG